MGVCISKHIVIKNLKYGYDSMYLEKQLINNNSYVVSDVYSDLCFLLNNNGCNSFDNRTGIHLDYGLKSYEMFYHMKSATKRKLLLEKNDERFYNTGTHIDKETIFYDILKWIYSKTDKRLSHTMVLTNKCADKHPVRVIIIFNKINKFYPLMVDTILFYGETIFINNNYAIDNIILIIGWNVVFLCFRVDTIYEIMEHCDKIEYHYDICKNNVGTRFVPTKYVGELLFVTTKNILHPLKKKKIPTVVKFKNTLYGRINYCFYSINRTNDDILSIYDFIKERKKSYDI